MQVSIKSPSIADTSRVEPFNRTKLSNWEIPRQTADRQLQRQTTSFLHETLEHERVRQKRNADSD